MVQEERAVKWQVGAIAKPLPAVRPDMPCGRVYGLMQSVGAETGLAVVKDGIPVGLASRTVLMKNFAHPVSYALFENRPVSLLMQTEPLVVEATSSIDRVSERIATEKSSALDEGFVVVDEGRFTGVACATDLLDLSVQKAREQIAALEQARAEAEAASRSKSQFLANLSHELRTPLNAILGFSQLIAAETAGPVTRKQAEYLNDIETSGKRLLDLINDLLDLSRAEAGRLDLDETNAELDLLMAEAHRTLMPRARDKGLTLINKGGAGAIVWGDEGKLLQVFLNLLNNAVKFTPAGGTVELAALLRQDGCLAIQVTDTGPGIDAADRARILEPFGRGRDAAVRHSEGAGIGLALTKVLVEAHQGQLELASAPGAGTRFTMVLPSGRLVAKPALRPAAAAGGV